MRKPCYDHKQDMNKGAWSKQEDQKLIDYIKKHGEVCWRTVPQAAGLLRCGKSCRLRWINYLRPDLKRGNFTEDEEDLIIKLHALLGNRWSLIAGRLPGRTDNEVKNYWNSHIRRKLISMGIDPNNHRLSHKIPALDQNPNPPMPGSSKSCGSKGNAKMNNGATTKGHVDINNGDQQVVSDGASGDGSHDQLPDLNLDLNISAPTASPYSITNIAESENNLKPIHECKASREVGVINFASSSSSSSTTLLLFQ